jgi:hypothetical protein
MRGTSLGGILYTRATTYWGGSKGAYGWRMAIVIGSNKSTAQSSLLLQPSAATPREHVREMEEHLREMGEYLRRMGERLRRLDEQLSHLEAEDDRAVDRGRGWPSGG